MGTSTGIFIPLIICTGSLLSSTAQENRCIPPGPGLIGWWPGDGDATDLVQQQNGVSTNLTFGPGLNGQAFRFIGNTALQIDSFVRIPNQQAFSALTNVTLECWVWNDPEKPFNRVLTLTPDWVRLGLSGSSQPTFTLSTADSQLVTAISTDPLTPGTWHHLVGTFDAKGAELFVDGLLAATATTTRSMSNQGAAPELYMNYFGNNAAGLIDEPACYSRALSPDEILEHFKAGPAGMCKSLTFSIPEPFKPLTTSRSGPPSRPFQTSPGERRCPILRRGR